MSANMTPGPWRAEQHPLEVEMGGHPRDWEIQARDPGGRFGWCQHIACARLESDARAIAALPELIEAARELLRTDDVRCLHDDTEGCASCDLRRVLARIDGGDNVST